MVTAVSANLAVFTVARELAGVRFIMPLRPEAPPVSLPMSMVAMATAIPAIGATITYGILHNFIPRAVFVFRIGSAAFFLLSLAGPLSLPVEILTKFALAFMHCVAGVTIVGILTTFAAE